MLKRILHGVKWLNIRDLVIGALKQSWSMTPFFIVTYHPENGKP
jgi:hypothetical protein